MTIECPCPCNCDGKVREDDERCDACFFECCSVCGEVANEMGFCAECTETLIFRLKKVEVDDN